MPCSSEPQGVKIINGCCVWEQKALGRRVPQYRVNAVNSADPGSREEGKEAKSDVLRAARRACGCGAECGGAVPMHSLRLLA